MDTTNMHINWTQLRTFCWASLGTRCNFNWTINIYLVSRSKSRYTRSRNLIKYYDGPDCVSQLYYAKVPNRTGPGLDPTKHRARSGSLCVCACQWAYFGGKCFHPVLEPLFWVKIQTQGKKWKCGACVLPTSKHTWITWFRPPFGHHHQVSDSYTTTHYHHHRPYTTAAKTFFIIFSNGGGKRVCNSDHHVLI